MSSILIVDDEAGVRADAWAAQEAKSGRVYACGKRAVAGFPFRFEVSCNDASVSLFSQTADAKALFTARLKHHVPYSLHGYFTPRLF